MCGRFLGDAKKHTKNVKIQNLTPVLSKQKKEWQAKTIGCKQHFGTELFSAFIISANDTSQNSKLYTKIIALLLSLIETTRSIKTFGFFLFRFRHTCKRK